MLSVLLLLAASYDSALAVLPEADARAVRASLAKKDEEGALRILDSHCLIEVTINPESRVKAVRGKRSATLVLGKPSFVLVRVQNDGGVTHPLGVASPEAIIPGTKDAGRWVELSFPDAKGLTGRDVEYRVLRLLPQQAGKREAVLAFDVGQGTQDLGFRAEVPVLFAVASK